MIPTPMTPEQSAAALRNREELRQRLTVMAGELNLRRARLGQAGLRFLGSASLRAFNFVELSDCDCGCGPCLARREPFP